MTLSVSSAYPNPDGASALTSEGSHEKVAMIDSMAQIGACINNLHNVRDFLAERGAFLCAKECERMLIGAKASERRISALALATDVAFAPCRTAESISASLLADLITESYQQGEESLLEKANKLWAIMLQKRLRKKHNDAYLRIRDEVSNLSQSIILETVAREQLFDFGHA